MVSAVREKEQDKSSAMRDLLNNPYLSLSSRLVLGGVFLYAGVTKVLDPGGLASSIRSYDLPLPEWFVSLSAHSLPFLEILLGFYLIIGLFTKSSAWVTSGLMVLFIFALLQGAMRGLEIDCGCFGSSADGGEPENLWVDAARDVGLLALGLHVSLAPVSRFSVDARLRQQKTK
jgi:putative oxidoreductase